MAKQYHRSPPSVPDATTYRAKLEARRQLRDNVEVMLRRYWAFLLEDSAPLAEIIVERALKEAALRGTLFV